MGEAARIEKFTILVKNILFMSNIQSKVSNSALATQIGATVTVRFTADESNKTGRVGAYDSVKQLIRMDQGKRHFWITSLDSPAHIISHTADNLS